MTENDQALVRQADTPLMPTPVFTGQQMGKALAAYKELQTALDEAMPDQLMPIGTGKNQKIFRRKGYWRAVRVAFNLEVELVSEERIVAGEFGDGRENFAYNVTYRASAHGVSVTGDGAASAVEKARKFRCPHPHPTKQNYTLHWKPEDCPAYDPGYIWRVLPIEATEHNIRSHAHTRAFNRAVSNLCGFGEVSADEIRDPEQLEDEPPVVATVAPPRPSTRPATMDNELPPETSGNYVDPYQQSAPQPNPRQHPRSQAAPPPAKPEPIQHVRAGGPFISEKQDGRYFAIAMKKGWKANDLKAALQEAWGISNSKEIPRAKYDDVIAWVEQGPVE